MDLFTNYLWPCLLAFGAGMGFCILYDIHGIGMVFCSLGGSLGWLAYLIVQTFTGSAALSSFVAGVLIAAYSETMARIRKCPVSGYLLLSFFPLVPGAGVYRTMEYFINGDNPRFTNSAWNTLSVAGGLALGVLLVSSLVRMSNTFYRGRKKRRGNL